MKLSFQNSCHYLHADIGRVSLFWFKKLSWWTGFQRFGDVVQFGPVSVILRKEV